MKTPLMTRTLALRLRRCTRCGHQECPCCKDFCDDIDCIDADEGAEGKCGTMECLYREIPDFDGYTRLKREEERHVEANGGHIFGFRVEVVDEATVRITTAAPPEVA